MSITLRHLYVIARNAFVESIRDRVLQIIGVFALAFIAYALFMSGISLGEDLHVLRTLGLAGIYILGLITTVFLGSSLVYREFERKTLYFILSKPVTREELLVGKFFGLYASIALGILGMTAVYLGVVAYAGGGFDAGALAAVCFELLEVAVIIALSIFFSSFARPLSTVLYTVLGVYIGHSLGQLVDFTRTGNAFLHGVFEACYYVLPNLSKFDIRDAVVYGSMPPPSAAFFAFGYALIYAVILLWAALLIFKKREL